jgi:hypothetical protein
MSTKRKLPLETLMKLVLCMTNRSTNNEILAFFNGEKAVLAQGT